MNYNNFTGTLISEHLVEHYSKYELQTLKLGNQQLLLSFILGIAGILVALRIFRKQYKISLDQVKLGDKQIDITKIIYDIETLKETKQAKINELSNIQHRIDTANDYLNRCTHIKGEDRKKYKLITDREETVEKLNIIKLSIISNINLLQDKIVSLTNKLV